MATRGRKAKTIVEIKAAYSPSAKMGAILRQERLSREISLVAFAKSIDYGKGYISRVETGSVQNIPDEVIRLYEERLNIAENTLLREKRRIYTNGGKTESDIYTNLPPKTSTFTGYREQLKVICFRLNNPEYPVLSIEGPPGVGKTTLAQEVGYLALNRISTEDPELHIFPPFQAVVWILAPEQKIQEIEGLDAIFDKIGRVLGLGGIENLDSLEQKRLRLEARMHEIKTLIIIDGYDYDIPKKVQEWLKLISMPSKAIITSQQLQTRAILPVTLDGLQREEALLFIQNRLADLHLSTVEQSIREREQYAKLAAVVSYNPYALEMAVGLIDDDLLSLRQVIEELQKGGANATPILDRLFGTSWPLLTDDSKKLFSAWTVFSSRTVSDASLSYVSGLDFKAVNEAKKQLLRLFLIKRGSSPTDEHQFYAIHSLAREFARSQKYDNLEKGYDDAAWKMSIRKRWSEWYPTYAVKQGGLDWKDWFRKFDSLELEWEDIVAFCKWCRESDNFDYMIELWSLAGLSSFSDIYGHWRSRRENFEWIVKKAEKLEKDGSYSDEDKRAIRAKRIYALSCLGWTYGLLGGEENLAKGKECLDEALKHCDLLASAVSVFDSLYIQCDIVNNLASLCLRGKSYEQAEEWLKKQENLLTQMASEVIAVKDELGEQSEDYRNLAHLYQRQRLHIPYNYGQIRYGQAMIAKSNGDIAVAERYFVEAQEKFKQQVRASRDIEWQRSECAALNWIADCLIGRMHLNDRTVEVVEVEGYLVKASEIAEKNHDKRRIASIYLSYAHLWISDPQKVKGYLARLYPILKELDMQDKIKEVIGEFTAILTSYQMQQVFGVHYA